MDNIKYEAVMGLEIHVELNTDSKMFCSCSADYFGKSPNSHTCPVCLGLPGAVPYMNQAALEKCIQIGLALGCTIQNNSRFERKNYFYPDLPKSYQISQYRWPLCINGSIEVTSEDGQTRQIRINRVHQEEDTGKLTHQGDQTLIDYNRSSVPLTEIVTEPDFKDVEEVVDYAKKLQQIFRYLGVSNADMERGDMRLEANISVRPVGQTELPNYRVELKNINSFRFMKQAINYEIKRQIEAHQKGQKLVQETRGWNEAKQQTFVQRSKEEANDYRYFPDPDLPDIYFSDQQIDQIRQILPELPIQRITRYQTDYSLKTDAAKILVDDPLLADYFEAATKVDPSVSAVKIANYLINQKIDIIQVSVDQLIKDLNAKTTDLITDKDQLKVIAESIIAENPAGAVDSYKAGKSSAIQVLIGQMMRQTQGKADPQITKQLFEDLLK